MRILLIEDEKKIASFIERGLKEERYAVDTAADAAGGLFLAEINPYDLIILDIMLPDQDGLQVCRKLRENKLDTPILMLTAKGELRDRVQGLDAGADDYLAKPFHFEEFLARIRALLRRKKTQRSSILTAGDLTLNQLTHEVTRAGKKIDVSAKEYALLEYLMLNVNAVVTRTMISEHVWNEHYDSFTNVIDVYINFLRKKIDSGFKKKLIHTYRGSGYSLKE